MTDGSPATAFDQYLVQYGKSGGLGCFTADEPLTLTRGQAVLVESPRGLEVGSVIRSATLLQSRLFGAVASGRLLRCFSAAEQHGLREHRQRSDQLFAKIRSAIADAACPFAAIDLDLCFGQDRAILHVLANADQDLTSFVADLSAHVGLDLRIENLAADASAPAEEPETEAGCGKPNCGQADGESSGGCTSCSSEGGGCSSGGCGTANIDWRAFFSNLRDRTPVARRPLL